MDTSDTALLPLTTSLGIMSGVFCEKEKMHQKTLSARLHTTPQPAHALQQCHAALHDREARGQGAVEALDRETMLTSTALYRSLSDRSSGSISTTN